MQANYYLKDKFKDGLIAFYKFLPNSWCIRNGLKVCVDKCQCISFSRVRNPIIFNYSMRDSHLVRTSCIRDLGVLLDDKLSFRPHIDSVIAKGNQLANPITRTCSEFIDPVCIKSIYCSIVRSCLEYCSPVWCPLTVGDINRLEALQRKITRYHTRPSYHQRCLLLRL